MTATPIYAALLALVFVLLSVRVIATRRASGIALGDGGDVTMLRRQRVHANFAEYVPLALILMFLAELQGAPKLLVHSLGIGLVAGRLTHAFGVSQETEAFALRVVGMALTFGALIIGAVLNLGLAVRT